LSTPETLSVVNHDRDSAALEYVYPVVSRRAGGVSIGINLNPNNACNWRCIYCQVPNLTRGAPPAIDLAVLENELRGFIEKLLHGDFMQQRVPSEARRINDIALSGNGEPTSAAEFPQVIDLIACVRRETDLPDTVKTVLITNGSLLHRSSIQAALRVMATLKGEVWYKIDRASTAGMKQINDINNNMKKVRDNLIACIAACPTWIQTCWFAVDGTSPSRQDETDYLEFIADLIRQGHCPQGVLLYGLARPSLQAEAQRLSAISADTMEYFANKIRVLGVTVKVST